MMHLNKKVKSCFVFFSYLINEIEASIHFTYVDNNKQHATFSTNNKYTEQLFKNLVDRYNWPGYFDTINANNQSNDKLKTSALLNLLAQPVQNLIPYLKPSLDNSSSKRYNKQIQRLATEHIKIIL